MSKKRILVVDDEVNILELIRYNLEKSGYIPITAKSGEEALEKIKQEKIDLGILDLMLPGIDGIELLGEIRLNPMYHKLPIIFLTAKSDEISRVIGLEVGADDYIPKPFGVHELLARIKAIFRRLEGSLSATDDSILKIRHITIDKKSRVVLVNNKEVEFSLKEFELLYLLIANQGMVFTRELILEKIWGYDYYGETRTVDVHISNLRKKIEDDEKEPKYIKTIRGIGYKFM